MEETKKLAELLEQLKAHGYDVKEANKENLVENSAISTKTLENLKSESSPAFEAWVAWPKAF